MTGEQIETVLLVTGAITASAGFAVIAPAAALKLLFGENRPDTPTVMITRHWGLLVTLVGGLLICAAYQPEIRLPIMVAAIVEKLAIGALIFGSAMRRRAAAAIVGGADTAMALLYIAILAR